MTTLHLHKLVLDSRAVLAFAKAQHLLDRRADADQGYLTHAALAAALGDGAPNPFALEQDLDPSRIPHGDYTVLAYGERSREELRRHASAEHQHLLQWERSDAKVVPPLTEGTVLGFTTRVSPTVRTRGPAPGHEAHGRGNEREVDAFLAACFRAGPDVRVDRAAVYREWLARALRGPAAPAATLDDFSLRAFHRVTVLRKEQPTATGGRKRHQLDRPCAVITGTLRVTDADAFRALLARGVGRHRAFGFGMLLLRRA
ncbi:MAG: type I-E CRISPR-associated protein Cas6/Cse3/CasE [Sandaracinus sp.]